MRKVKINPSVADEEFTNRCIEMLNSAKKSVHIIAGELGSLAFPDLQMATYKASKRPGVKVKMYATGHTPESSRNYAVACGYDLYIGKKPHDPHYLLVDGKHFVESICKKEGEATVIGERKGWAHYNDKKGGQKILKLFEKLSTDKDAKKITSVNRKAEPLYQFLYS